jgi:hypothetical protein
VEDAVMKTFSRNCEVAVDDLSNLGKSLFACYAKVDFARPSKM